MAVVTFNGPIGAGGNEIGVLVAGLLNADYVDRLILAQAAKRIGSTVEVLEIKEQRKLALRDRLAYFLQTMLERSAMSGAGGEPYFSPGMEYLPSEEYTDLADEPLTAAQRLNDEHFIEVTRAVIKDLADGGNVVIIGRGSNVILKDVPGVL
ncbi:MAG: cytidylate kinase family protein, partial [Dehalococcoidia bacterium]|nr:cytidylate kinase family protein [Dehalococcoidia bacterium]